MLALGLLTAFASASLTSLGIALQASEARRVPLELQLQMSLIRRLAGRRRWLGGTAIVAGGWFLEALALLLAPLTAVQPAMVLGLVVLLVAGSRMLDERVGIVEYLGLGLILAGVTGVALVSPQREPDYVVDAALLAAIASLAAAATLPALWHRIRPHLGLSVWLLVLGAAAGYAFSSIGSKLVADTIDNGDLVLLAAWLPVTAWGAALGLLDEMSTYQVAPATRTGPPIFVLQVVIPVALAPALFGETWREPAPLVLALLGVVSGTVLLTRSRVIARMIGAQANRRDAGRQRT